MYESTPSFFSRFLYTILLRTARRVGVIMLLRMAIWHYIICEWYQRDCWLINIINLMMEDTNEVEQDANEVEQDEPRMKTT